MTAQKVHNGFPFFQGKAVEAHGLPSLPFSVPKSLKASTRSSSFGSMRERWSIREIGRVGAGSSLDEDERVWYDLSKRDDGIRP